MITLFSSDYHLNHANIIRYCHRPFMKPGDLDSNGNWVSKEISMKRVEWMNRTIIRNHNARGGKNDVLIHIGDFCFCNGKGGKLGEGGQIKSDDWENQMNGKIIHISGNHDSNNSTRTIIQGILIKIGGKKIWCVHKPEHANINYSINFVGHKHEKWKFKRINGHCGVVDLINVGVDVWGFMPVTFNEIMSEYYKWKKLNDAFLSHN